MSGYMHDMAFDQQHAKDAATEATARSPRRLTRAEVIAAALAPRTMVDDVLDREPYRVTKPTS